MRGFTLAELKNAGFSEKPALSIGIAVDNRRKNPSTEFKFFHLHLNRLHLKLKESFDSFFIF